ncbi:hypothetical protein M5D96_004235 [Drosophila gunungcola]|uniref:Uncharacterized protein n=1 Tax=Drosophila gunungcola TaxID=103775 RepID=A0A9P9YTQ6_9MUSC|nr:hypothetical protein M5D96_004235 [Drosophila gunungcola]
MLDPGIRLGRHLTVMWRANERFHPLWPAFGCGCPAIGFRHEGFQLVIQLWKPTPFAYRIAMNALYFISFYGIPIGFIVLHARSQPPGFPVNRNWCDFRPPHLFLSSVLF